MTRSKVKVATAHQQPGFTLLEVLVALVLLALLGSLSAFALSNSLNNEAQLTEKIGNLEALQRTHDQLRQDLQQLIPRMGRDELGDVRQAAIISTIDISNPQLPLLEFFRAGRRLVGSQFVGSSLERVRYRLKNQQLIREASTALDPADDTVWRRQVLLQQISSLQLSFYFEGRWLNTWPTAGIPPQVMPQAARIVFTVPRYGQIEQLILLPEAS